MFWLDGYLVVQLNSNIYIPFPSSLPSLFLFFFASEILKSKEEKLRSDQVIKSVEGKPKVERRKVKGGECNERRVGRLECIDLVD